MDREPTIYVSGLYSGTNPQPGVGIARSLRQGYPGAKLIGVEIPEAIDKYAPRQADLKDAMELVVLNPDSEAAKR